ncbi:hypothetical protein ENT52713_15270 [Enterobacter sp. 200527-13]|uniref:hypothetical protein n=1 Tax=Enterobacter TaxID=547 RepID=UPI0022C95F69|nr:hypothetical protein [Enterobacter sp. 200527-13]GLH24131.1 hypothetical protein ENT52713_15270 [Enterobacter sp. 200527-13]
MKIFILDAQSEVVEIIDEPDQTSTIRAAQAAIIEAALLGKKFTAVNEDGESALPAEFDEITPAGPAATPDVKFLGYQTDILGDKLPTFSGAF